MKANELMIGDWVLAQFINGDRYARISAIAIDCAVVSVGDREYEHDYDAVLPITLTEEILKANGFLESIEEGTFYFPQEDINQLGYAIETDDGEAFFITGHELIVFDYVHELQQVLRLCGLEELADNFKLE